MIEVFNLKMEIINNLSDILEIEEEGKKQNNKNRLNIIKLNNIKIKYFHNRVYKVFLKLYL